MQEAWSQGLHESSPGYSEYQRLFFENRESAYLRRRGFISGLVTVEGQAILVGQSR